MSETDAPAAPEQPPPQFELEQSDQYSKYLLHSRPEILAVLRSLIQKRAMITAYFDHGRSFLLTSIIALDAENSAFLLDPANDEGINQKALQAEKLIFTTFVDKVKIQFSLNRLSPTQFEGRSAFLGAIPDSLLRLQRREYFRLATSIANPIKLRAIARRVDGSALQVELPLLDISGGGIGLMATMEQAQNIQLGETLKECKMLLPEEGVLTVSLFVRNVFDVVTRSGARYIRVGCEFIGLPAARLNVVQRFITRVERERKARLNGLA